MSIRSKAVVVAQLVEWLLPTQWSSVRFQTSWKFMLNVYCQLYWNLKRQKSGREWSIFNDQSAHKSMTMPPSFSPEKTWFYCPIWENNVSIIIASEIFIFPLNIEHLRLQKRLCLTFYYMSYANFEVTYLLYATISGLSYKGSTCDCRLQF